MFKQYIDNIHWYISAKDLLGEDVGRDEDIFSLFFFLEHNPTLYTSFYKKIYIDNTVLL